MNARVIVSLASPAKSVEVTGVSGESADDVVDDMVMYITSWLSLSSR
jgi:hypothetical protein